MKFFYRCSECGRTYPIEPNYMVCPVCRLNQDKDKPLRGILEVDFEIEGEPLKNEIFEFLPVERKYFPHIPVGNTPLWRARNLEKLYGVQEIYIKDDSRNPTGSLKDRASYLVAAFARKFNIKEIAVASTGNAASSMAGIGASAGLKVTIFVPETAPIPKLVQSLQYGAKVIRVKGNYDLAYELSLEYSAKKGVLSRNTAYNPLTIEGKKTVSIEIFNEIGIENLTIFVPVGDGVILGGVYKGFKDLLKLGFIEEVPEIYAVQAEKSDAICRAFEKGEFERLPSETIADSISVEIPRNGYYAVKQLKEFSGKCIRVRDKEILEAQHILARAEGVFAEPAAAASFAGFLKVRDRVKGKRVVLLITGSGLKDVESAMKIVRIEGEPVKSFDEIGH